VEVEREHGERERERERDREIREKIKKAKTLKPSISLHKQWWMPPPNQEERGVKINTG